MAGRWRGEGGQHQGARPYQEDSWALRTLGDGSLLAVVADVGIVGRHRPGEARHEQHGDDYPRPHRAQPVQIRIEP